MHPIPIVYFITAPEKALYPVKIGRSSTASIHKRMRDLQSAHPYRLGFLLIIEGGAAQEANAHQAFADLRLSGEWFRRTSDLMRVIADLEQGDPDWHRYLEQPHIQYNDDGSRAWEQPSSADVTLPA